MRGKTRRRLSLVLLAIAFVVTAISGLILNAKLNQPKDDEEAIRQEFARIRAPAKEWLEKHGMEDEIININIQGDWAMLEFGGIDLETEEPIAAGPGLMVFRKVMGIWIGDRRGGPWLFRLFVRTAPESVFSKEDREFFLP